MQLTRRPIGTISSGLQTGLLTAGLFVAGLSTIGCATKPMAQAAPPANPDTLRLVRQSLKEGDPNVLVGMVVAVLPDTKYAAVGDIDVKEFRVDEPITFIDSNKKFICNGLVKHIGDDTLDVQYVTADAMSPAPKVGDLAVRFKLSTNP